jgi:hypothetical protein
MPRKVLIDPATGLEDPERVTVAFLVGRAAVQARRESALAANASLAGATPMREWIGDDDAMVFGY